MATFAPGIGARGQLTPRSFQLSGLLCIWNKEVMDVNTSFVGKGFLGVQGVLKEGNVPCFIFNIYAPCDFKIVRVVIYQLETLFIGVFSLY